MRCPSCKGHGSFEMSNDEELTRLVITHSIDCDCINCKKYNKTTNNVDCDLCNGSGESK